jgi:hypothetical protein
MSPTVVNDVAIIVKPRRLRCNPEFLSRTCEGNHLTRLCLDIVGIPEAWRSPKGPSYSEVSVVSPHLVSPLIDMAIMLLQSSPDHTLVFKGDVSSIPIILHPLQPRVEEVVVQVQSLVNPTLLVEGGSSFNHVVSILDPTPYERDRFFLSPIYLPLCLEEIPFDWDNLVGYPIPPPMSFIVRDIIRYIMEDISFISALSSSTWRDLGFPKLMSTIRKILRFHKSPAWEPLHPP